MKPRTLLPTTVLEDNSTASADRILARGFWKEESGQGADVVRLETCRSERESRAASRTNP